MDTKTSHAERRVRLARIIDRVVGGSDIATAARDAGYTRQRVYQVVSEHIDSGHLTRDDTGLRWTPQGVTWRAWIEYGAARRALVEATRGDPEPP